MNEHQKAFWHKIQNYKSSQMQLQSCSYSLICFQSLIAGAAVAAAVAVVFFCALRNVCTIYVRACNSRVNFMKSHYMWWWFVAAMQWLLRFALLLALRTALDIQRLSESNISNNEAYKLDRFANDFLLYRHGAATQNWELSAQNAMDPKCRLCAFLSMRWALVCTPSTSFL